MYNSDCRIPASDIGGEIEVFVEDGDPDELDEVDAESISWFAVSMYDECVKAIGATDEVGMYALSFPG